MSIDFQGGNPTVDLGAQNYTRSANELAGLVCWHQWSAAFATIVAGRATVIEPRAGSGNLVLDSQSIGPQFETVAGYEIADLTPDELNHMGVFADISEANFTLAAIVRITGTVNTSQDLMAVHAGGSSLRVWQSGYTFAVRAGAVDYALGADLRNAGWVLVIMSASGGQVRLRVRTPTVTDAVTSGARTPAFVNAAAVFGADEFDDGEGGDAPSAGRAWEDWIAETFVFTTDILAVDTAALTLLDSYFGDVYA
jgi:hypothetical protein